MRNTDRAADLKLFGTDNGRNQLSVIDEGDLVLFGLDLSQPGMRVSGGVKLNIEDAVRVRDMLNRIISRNTPQIPPAASDDPKLAAWRAQED